MGLAPCWLSHHSNTQYETTGSLAPEARKIAGYQQSDLIALIGSEGWWYQWYPSCYDSESPKWHLAVFTTFTSYIAKFQRILTSCTTFPVCFGCFLLGHKMIPFSGCHWNPIKNCSEAGIYKSATGVVYEGQFKTLGIAQAAQAALKRGSLWIWWILWILDADFFGISK
jgi:hypothetical protein